MSGTSELILFLLIISAFLALINSYFLFTKRGAPGAIYFALLMISVFIWTIGYIFELYFTEIDSKFLGLCLQYLLGIPFAPIFWLIAAIHYSSIGREPKKAKQVALYMIPTITMLLMWTTNSHGLYYYNFHIVDYHGFKILEKNWGIWFYINLVYDYLALLIGTIVLIGSLRRSKQLFRSQIYMFLIGLFLPWIANFIYVSGETSYMPIDITPIAFTFSVGAMGWAIYRYGLFDVIPAAHDTVIESMKNGILVIDKMGRIVDSNPAARNIFDNKIILGQYASDVLNEIHINSDLLEKEHSREININESTYNLVVSEVFDKRKKISGRLLTFFDITQLKKNEKELSELNATKDKFFSIIAHDLRNPFFGIMGLAEILADQTEDISPEEKEVMIKEIKELSTNTYQMLENLLDWSRQQTGRMKFHPEVIVLEDVIEENIAHLYKSAELKKINLTSRVFPGCKVFADVNMINTVMRNLVSNAIKFTPQTGTITIGCRDLNDKIEIQVCDNGVGMDEKILEQLFKLDKTVKTIGTSGEKGTGLGMVLCKEFVEKNGGGIWAESELGKGTTIYFSLPKKNPLSTN